MQSRVVEQEHEFQLDVSLLDGVSARLFQRPRFPAAKPGKCFKGGLWTQFLAVLCVCVCVESYTDLTPLHYCTFASLFSVLSCAVDHPSNAFASGQVVPHNRVAFDMVAERR